MFVVEKGTWRCVVLSKGLNSFIPKFHSLLKELQESGREHPWDPEHLCKPTKTLGRLWWPCQQTHRLNRRFGLAQRNADCTASERIQRDAQEHHPVWPWTSENLPMGGRQQSPGGKDVRSAACLNIWLLTMPLLISLSMHGTFKISKMCRLSVLWNGTPEGCWKGKECICSVSCTGTLVLGTARLSALEIALVGG